MLWWNDTDGGQPQYWRYTGDSATLWTSNLTQIGLGPSPGLRGERPATDRLSHGTASET